MNVGGFVEQSFTDRQFLIHDNEKGQKSGWRLLAIRYLSDDI